MLTLCSDVLARVLGGYRQPAKLPRSARGTDLLKPGSLIGDLKALLPKLPMEK